MKEIGGFAQQHLEGGGHHHHQGGHHHHQDPYAHHGAGHHGHHGAGHHGHHVHHGHGHHGHGHGGKGKMNDEKAMKEAMKLAKNKDISQIDPAVLDYAATKLQAGFRVYMTRKCM